MAQLGANVEHLDRLARLMDQECSRIEQAAQQIGGEVQSAWWMGADADRFRGEWQGQYAPQLRQVASALQSTAQAIRAQADQQRQVSQS